MQLLKKKKKTKVKSENIFPMGSFIADYSDFYEYMSKYTWEGMHEPGGCMICLYSQHLRDSDGCISVNSRPA